MWIRLEFRETSGRAKKEILSFVNGGVRRLRRHSHTADRVLERSPHWRKQRRVMRVVMTAAMMHMCFVSSRARIIRAATTAATCNLDFRPSRPRGTATRVRLVMRVRRTNISRRLVGSAWRQIALSVNVFHDDELDDLMIG
jgi:hypothetical protein